MNVGEIMSRSVKLADPDMAIQDVAKIMRDEDIGALPVGENDRLVGMITDRDITVRMVAEGKSAEGTKVRDIMSSGVAYCFEDDELSAASDVMARHQIRRLPVVNRDKRLVGAVAMADLARNGQGDQSATWHAISEVSKESSGARTIGH